MVRSQLAFMLNDKPNKNVFDRLPVTMQDC